MTWIIPTMSRPKQCYDMVMNLAAQGMTSPGVVFVNGSQMEGQYKDLFDGTLPMGWEIIYNEKNLGALGAMNKVFEMKPHEKWYGFIGDDEWIETKYWDIKLIKAADDWNIAHANDGWQSGNRIHSHVCIGGELVRAVGYLSIADCWHWYGFDMMWEMIGKMLGLQKFCYDVKAKHNNYLKDEKLKDECYSLGEGKKDRDYDAFKQWESESRRAVLDRIKEKMNAIYSF
jgi:glycosyltransferase involved in cell wall biosynthesis